MILFSDFHILWECELMPKFLHMKHQHCPSIYCHYHYNFINSQMVIPHVLNNIKPVTSEVLHATSYQVQVPLRLSVSPPWSRAPCGTHDHTAICSRTVTVLVVMGRPL